MPDAMLYELNTQMENLAAVHARNLSIPAPYNWDWYSHPRQTTTTNFVDYYKSTMKNHGYKNVFDLEDAEGIYLLKFQKGNEMYAVLFWKEQGGYYADTLIFRWIK